jgi:hypothetical protein
LIDQLLNAGQEAEAVAAEPSKLTIKALVDLYLASESYLGPTKRVLALDDEL